MKRNTKWGLVLLFIMAVLILKPVNKAQTADSVIAQLAIDAQAPIADIVVSGVNQNDDAATWHNFDPFSQEWIEYNPYLQPEPLTYLTLDNWWWRFMNTCVIVNNDCIATENASPYVWVRYFDGHVERQRCHLDRPSVERSEQWVTCRFSYTYTYDFAPRPDYILEKNDGGVSLYATRSNQSIVQAVQLSAGGIIQLRHGPVINTEDDQISPNFAKQTLREAWTDFTNATPRPLCITNGQFFSRDNAYMSPLAFPVKANGELVSAGYGAAEFPDEKLMLEMWADRATIRPYSLADFQSSTAPNIIVGLSEYAPKFPSGEIGRTFIGVKDTNNDAINDTVLIFNSRGSSQPDAASTLRDRFGASDVMMLDGGGSTQLICDGRIRIPSPDGLNGRLIPQTLATTTTADISQTTSLERSVTVSQDDVSTSFIPVPYGLSRVSFSVQWQSGDILMKLISPSGVVYERGYAYQDVTHSLRPTQEIFTLLNPEPGDWSVQLHGLDVPPDDGPVQLRFNAGAAPPPALASIEGNTLILNMGIEERRQNRGVETDEINETFIVEQMRPGLPGQFAVSAFGVTQVYTDITTIIADGYDGNDVLLVKEGAVEFTANVEFYDSFVDDNTPEEDIPPVDKSLWQSRIE